MKNINIPNNAVILNGSTLDDAPDLLWLTAENIIDIKAVLAYDYEDGKPCHDMTCVMEIHFHNFQENIGDTKLRILYGSPAELLSQLSQILLDGDITENTTTNWFGPSCLFTVKIDLRCSYLNHEDTEESIDKSDFDEFNCRIVHKKRFSPHNPDMPWD